VRHVPTFQHPFFWVGLKGVESKPEPETFADPNRESGIIIVTVSGLIKNTIRFCPVTECFVSSAKRSNNASTKVVAFTVNFVDLRRSNIRDEGATTIAKGLERNKTLGDEGAVAVARALETEERLEDDLGLQRKRSSEKQYLEMKVPQPLLGPGKQTKVLEDVDLLDNDDGDEGAIAPLPRRRSKPNKTVRRIELFVEGNWR